mmetsp:Transcript_26239/g.25844  ORF Transcript_26239/g.25844 Transcript_26239/m.25844 type:complete len:109 (+) Transcript_26239:287-613(+)
MQENPKLSTSKPPENLKRPLTISYRIPEITKINENKKHKPPSRHKTPPKALNLICLLVAVPQPKKLLQKTCLKKPGVSTQKFQKTMSRNIQIERLQNPLHLSMHGMKV